MVEEVDIYPSLVALHYGAAAVPAALEGESWVPLLQLSGQGVLIFCISFSDSP